MELIVISNPIAGINEAELINGLFRAGLKYFHLRKPKSDRQAQRDLLLEIDPEFWDRIALHQYHDMADEFGIKRLHYTESARQLPSCGTMLKQIADGYRLSTSIHDMISIPEIEHFHYVFYGPVFNSISKAGYQSVVPEDFILEKNGYKNNVIALGGVQSSNLRQIRSMGFDGAAVLGTLWNQPHNAVERFNELQGLLTFKTI
jgi:thiamine-phosphate pyrophosphorylase